MVCMFRCSQLTLLQQMVCDLGGGCERACSPPPITPIPPTYTQTLQTRLLLCDPAPPPSQLPHCKLTCSACMARHPYTPHLHVPQTMFLPLLRDDDGIGAGVVEARLVTRGELGGRYAGPYCVVGRRLRKPQGAVHGSYLGARRQAAEAVKLRLLEEGHCTLRQRCQSQFKGQGTSVSPG